MDENEEFEFRQRAEQEQTAQAQPPAPAAPERGYKDITPGLASSALGAASEMLPWNRAQAATTGALGEKVAETGGKMGYPTAGAVLGTGIQMAPDLLASGALESGLSETPLHITPQQIGAKMGAGEEAAGITSHLPELRGSTQRFPMERVAPTKQPFPTTPAEPLPTTTPTSYPRDPNTFLNTANERMDKFGNKLGPQEVTDYQRQISDWFNRGKIAPNSPIGAVASQARNQASNLRNELVPGREALNEQYGLSKALHPDVIQALKDHFGKIALGALGMGAGYKLLR